MAALAPVIGAKSKHKEEREVSTTAILFSKTVKDFPDTSLRGLLLYTINQNCITQPFFT